VVAERFFSAARPLGAAKDMVLKVDAIACSSKYRE